MKGNEQDFQDEKKILLKAIDIEKLISIH